MSTGNRIHHINLMVDDLGLAVGFYRRAWAGPVATPEIGLPGAVLRDQRDATDSHQRTAGHHTGAVSLLPRVDDFNGKFRPMKAAWRDRDRNVGTGSERLPGGVMQMFVRDPDGNLDRDCRVRLIRRRPGDIRRGDVRARSPRSHRDRVARERPRRRAGDARGGRRRARDGRPIDARRPMSAGEGAGDADRGRGRITARDVAASRHLVVVGRCGAGSRQHRRRLLPSRRASSSCTLRGHHRTRSAEHGLLLMLALAGGW